MAETQTSRATIFMTNAATVLLVAGIAFGVFLVASALDGAIRGGHELAVHQEVSADEVSSLPPTVDRPQTVPVTVHIKDARPNQVFVFMARDLVAVALVVALLWLLRLLLRSVRDGDPFTAANVRRLRAIGFLLVVGAPVAALVAHACDQWLASTSKAGELGTSFTLPGRRSDRRPRRVRAGGGVRSRRAPARRRRGHGLRVASLSESGIAVHLDELLEQRGMTLTELADQVDITVVNLSVLKNGRARAVRFSTLAALCDALACNPGDLMSYEP